MPKKDAASKEEIKLARYGPDAKHGYRTPSAGFCISSFALIRQIVPGSKQAPQKILLIKPRPNENWMMNWSSQRVLKNLYPDEYRRTFRSWMFPCTYLREGEHPDDAIRRVLEDQLHLSLYKVTYPGKLEVFFDPSDWYRGRNHWDYCFVYKVATRENLAAKKLPWIKEMKFVDSKEFSELGRRNFAVEIGDLAARLGLV